MMMSETRSRQSRRARGRGELIPARKSLPALAAATTSSRLFNVLLLASLPVLPPITPPWPPSTSPKSAAVRNSPFSDCMRTELTN